MSKGWDDIQHWKDILADLERQCTKRNRDDNFNPHDQVRALVAAIMAVRESIESGRRRELVAIVAVLFLQVLTLLVLSLK